MLRPDDLAPHFARGRVVSVSRRTHPYGTSHPIDELTVHFASGGALTLIAKDTAGLSSQAAVARAGRPTAARELEVYRTLLVPLELPAPRVYGVVGDVLLLERVRGRPLWQVGEVEHWEAAAAALADLHDRTLGIDDPVLPAADWPAPVAGLESACTAASRILGELPRVLVHGDCYPSNVLVRDGGGVSFVDWEEAVLGPGVLDLAALTAGWDACTSGAIVRAYEERSGWVRGLGGAGVFARALAAARLVVAGRWINAPSAWRPPEEHAHDWHAEAVAAAGAVA